MVAEKKAVVLGSKEANEVLKRDKERNVVGAGVPDYGKLPVRPKRDANGELIDYGDEGGRELTTTQAAELGHYETVIRRGIETFWAVGSALLAIRRDRLYRATHATFEAYLEDRWQMTRDYANKLIGASEVVTNLNTIVSVLPANEAQARPLTKLEPEQQVEAWTKAVDEAEGKMPTAAQVAKAASEFAPPKPPKVKPVQEVYAPIWQLDAKVREWLTREIGETGLPDIDSVLDALKTQVDQPLRTNSWLQLIDAAIKNEGLHFRSSDLVQAINNVRDQRKQARRQAGARTVYTEPAAEPMTVEATPDKPSRRIVDDYDVPPDLKRYGYYLQDFGNTWGWASRNGGGCGPDTSRDQAIENARSRLASENWLGRLLVDPKATPEARQRAILGILMTGIPTDINFHCALENATADQLTEALDKIPAEGNKVKREKIGVQLRKLEREQSNSKVDIINRDLDAYEVEARAAYIAPAPVPLPVSVAHVQLDPRIGQASMLRYMLTQVRKVAAEQFGELTGQHTLLPAFERSVAEMIEPLDSLIEILSNGEVVAAND